jgi:hypothetical protein
MHRWLNCQSVLLETNHPSNHTFVWQGTAAVLPKSKWSKFSCIIRPYWKNIQVYSQHETLPQAYIQFCNEHNINMSLKLSLSLEQNTTAFQSEVYASNVSEAENTERVYRNRNETSVLCQKVWHWLKHLIITRSVLNLSGMAISLLLARHKILQLVWVASHGGV